MHTLDPGDFRIDRPTKGAPPDLASLDRTSIRTAGWHLFHDDVPLPAAVLLNTVLKRNSQWMREFLTGFGASMAPHGKTTMSPQLFTLQLQDGCWGITLATCYQVQIARRYGFKRILVANEIVSRSDIDYLVGEMAADPEFDFYCYVDSKESVARLREGVQRGGLRRPIKVFIEVGFTGGRCGVRSVQQGIEVARQVRAAQPSLALAGVAGFEGLYQGRLNEDRVQLVTSFLQRIVQLAGGIDQLDLFDGEETILTAGGSSYYDLVSEQFSAVKLARPVRVITRSGCYLTSDAGMYRRLQNELDQRSEHGSRPSLASALEVWTHIISKPEPGLVILSAGRRDFGTDAGNPVPLKWVQPEGVPVALTDCEITAVFDQHASLRIAGDHPCEVGDMVGLGVSHPCTTFDKWKLIYLVDDEYRIIDAIETFF